MNNLDLTPEDEADLFLTPLDDPNDRSKWLYNPTNPYNFRTDTGTIIHLIQPANTLSAEIDIAAQATVIRKDAQGKVITSSDQLIRCSQYGNPNRNSDPTVRAPLSLCQRYMYLQTFPLDWLSYQCPSQARKLYLHSRSRRTLHQ